MLFIEVEYDLSYFGGDYDDIGTIVQIPESSLPKESDDFDADVMKAFQEQTGIDPIHVIHFSNEFVEEGFEGSYDYNHIEECQADGVHLTSCDNDGCCNFCGEF